MKSVYKTRYTYIHIQIKPKSQFEFVSRDTEKPEFLELVDFWGVAISVETVIE